MYTEKDLTEAKSALNKFVILYSLLAILFLGAIITDQFIRLEWLSYVSAGILAVATMFLWGNYGIRLVAWHRFLKDMEKGLERSVTGVLASIDEEEAIKEGLEFKALRLMTGEESDKAGGRLVYADASRFPLPVGIGQRVHCRLYGNYVKDMKESEDK